MNRFLYSDNGTLIDYSKELNEYDSLNVDFTWVAAEDYLYIGTLLPFNNLWFELATVNSDNSTISVDIWWSNEWKSAVDILDYTKSSGATLAESNRLTWNVYKDYSWDMELESEDVTGLTGTSIYNYYWSRISFSDDLSFTLKYLGQKFSDDADLYLRYPDLDNDTLKAAFASGKTDWKDQTFIAAENIADELVRRGVIYSHLQLMRPNILKEASVHYTAFVIYAALGKNYEKNRIEAYRMFEKLIHKKNFGIDHNLDGRLNTWERFNRTGYLTR